ncbi:hypothetical protein [Arcobacter porcinus]|uniref:Uncharacterized protein n=1 Tax=Arcobacter porcinus TaxID=1935204 RepID=A0A5C2HE44_9BACT|nr:hypothetical protein [Arcobacter porcinus]OCL87925.1 hypothetical protein AAX30_00532 [Arcobacter porcinus]OCL94427.1 hypothetical protein AAX27_00985 [Aliarcobacter thereius]QEP41226.1 hypothetical protein APORC_1659 [Arcobacter porcinus]
MKKILFIIIIIAISVAVYFTLTAKDVKATTKVAQQVEEDYSTLDVKKECNVEENGLQKVIETAEKYNKIAIEHKVEFMRFGMKNSQYIEVSKNAIAKNEKEVALVDNKGKATGDIVSTEFATWRACSFAISALTQEIQSKKTWRLASPSDEYKY